MVKEIITKNDAAHEWVKEFDAIRQEMIAKLMKYEPDDWCEVTMPSVCDRVYCYEEEERGKITDIDENEDGNIVYEIELDNGKIVNYPADDFEVEYDDYLPMWGTMWQFHDNCDNWWLEEDGGLEIMSECGFRIFYSDEFGYWFGIDGAGYDFYEAHWIPLYEKRGLKWHSED
jgi:hypothetical protein